MRNKPLAFLAISLFVAVLGLAPRLSHADELNFPAQALSESLRALGNQTKTNMLFDPVVTAKVNAPAVSKAGGVEEALKKLLVGSGLTFRFVDPRTVTVIPEDRSGKEDVSKGSVGATALGNLRLAQTEATPEGNAMGEERQAAPKGEEGKEQGVQLEEIVVTGTYIRGTKPASSPLTVYDRQDIERSGVATVEQFARLMPENFSSLDSANFLGSSSGFSQKGSNTYFGTGFNLHGLGPGATLTLLNGHRLTPAGSDGGFVDVSLIPLSAIERIEVLTDGASATYGADAVAGVVNMILRKNYEGAETTLRYGDTTRGGGQESTVSQLLGTAWERGSVMFVYEYHEQDKILGSQRSFIPSEQDITTILPKQNRNSAFVSARQDILTHTTLIADMYYSDKDFSQDFLPFGGFDPTIVADAKGGASQYGGNLGLSHEFASDWRADLSLNYSNLKQRSRTSFPLFDEVDTLDTDTRLTEANLRAEGRLFSLPGGETRLAIGLAHRAEKLDSVNEIDSAGVVSGFNQSLKRKIASAYAELLLPFFGDSNAIKGMHRLDLSLASRYDNYDDVGSSWNPKFGLSWSPFTGLNLRSTYATSFRAPLLTSLNETSPFYVTFNIDNPNSPTGQTNTLTRQGVANAALQPEESESFTAGFDLEISGLPDLTIAGTYFHTVFSDRISIPPYFSIFSIYSQTDVLAPFFDFSPDPVAIQAIFDDPRNTVFDVAGAGPGGVEVFIDLRPANIAETRQSGIDLSAGYDLPSAHGTFHFSLSADHFLEIEYQPVLTAPSVKLLNIVGQPVDTRLRGSFGWSKGGLSSFLTLSHWDKYRNVFFSPSEDVASWTTADFQLSYTTDNQSVGLLKNTTVALSVQNLADRSPPDVAYPPGSSDAGYDTSNASALGRSISLTLRKAWDRKRQ